MLNIRFSNFIKRTVSSFTTLFGQPTKMPLLINKNYLFVQSVNFANYERFKDIFTIVSEGQQAVFDVTCTDDVDKFLGALHSRKPFIVYFYGERAGPCQNFLSKLEAKVVGQEGKILLAKFKVREGPIDDLSKYFGVNSLPCVTCLKGEFTARFKGDESNLDQLLEILLAIGEEEKKSAVGNE
ncbi:hypothetical protein ACQ4LE_002353 [Meloidogyne hapla]